MSKTKYISDSYEEFKALLIKDHYTEKTATWPTITKNGLVWPGSIYYEVDRLDFSHSEIYDIMNGTFDKFVIKIMGIGRKSSVTKYKTLPPGDFISSEELLDRLDEMSNFSR